MKRIKCKKARSLYVIFSGKTCHIYIMFISAIFLDILKLRILTLKAFLKKKTNNFLYIYGSVKRRIYIQTKFKRQTEFTLEQYFR